MRLDSRDAWGIHGGLTLKIMWKVLVCVERMQQLGISEGRNSKGSQLIWTTGIEPVCMCVHVWLKHCTCLFVGLSGETCTATHCLCRNRGLSAGRKSDAFCRTGVRLPWHGAWNDATPASEHGLDGGRTRLRVSAYDAAKARRRWGDVSILNSVISEFCSRCWFVQIVNGT